MNSQAFYEAMDAMDSLSDEPALTDAGIVPSLHNLKAKILRQGVSICAFSSLEKHLQFLFEDFMNSVSSTQIGFSDLPESLRSFLTIDSLAGFQTRMSFMEKQDRLPFAETNIGRLAGFSSNPVSYSAFGFSPRGSNVKEDDISNALSALGVLQPWVKLTALTHDVGAGRASLKDDFRNLAKTRHRSAHNPIVNVPNQDLRTNIQVARLTGIVVAATLADLKAVYKRARRPSEVVAGSASPSPSFRFVDIMAGGECLERKSLSGPGIKKYADLATAKSGALARRDRRLVVVRGLSRTPIEIVR